MLVKLVIKTKSVFLNLCHFSNYAYDVFVIFRVDENLMDFS